MLVPPLKLEIDVESGTQRVLAGETEEVKDGLWLRFIFKDRLEGKREN